MSSNTFRRAYRGLTDAEVARRDSIIDHAERIECHIRAQMRDRPVGQRELAIALTKLEEAVMWASKGITA
jgi:hypothetical protein